MSVRSAIALAGATLLAAATPARAAELFVNRFVDDGSVRPNLAADAEAPPGPAVWRVVHVAANALPREALPVPFDKPARPTAVARGTSSPELRVDETMVKRVPSFGPDPIGRVTLETVGPRGGGYFLGIGPTGDQMNEWRASWNAHCSPGGALQGMRLETLRLAEDGRATLEIADGLFDQASCAAAIQRRAALHPVLLLSEAKVPLVYGLRTDEGILLVFPPTTTLEADALGERVPVRTRTASNERGPFRSVLLPIGKGSAATAVATLSPASVEKWYATQTGHTAADTFPANQMLTLAVDVVQTVSDDSATIVLRTTQDTKEPRRPQIREFEPPPFRHLPTKR